MGWANYHFTHDSTENENLEFCIVLWGPLTEPVLVHVETSDFLTALGESFLNMGVLIWAKILSS